MTDKPELPDYLYVSINPFHPAKGPLYNTGSVPPRLGGHAKEYIRADLAERAQPTSEDKRTLLTELEAVNYELGYLDAKGLTPPKGTLYKRDELRQALLSSPPELNYNMDEAPKDGTMILTINSAGTFCTCNWDEMGWSPGMPPCWFPQTDAIAWQHLPAAPKVQE